MALDLQKFTALKTAVEQAQREADRAAGALEQTMAALKVEFDCGTLAAAQKLSAKLDKEAAVAEASFTEALAEFESDWEQRL